MNRGSPSIGGARIRAASGFNEAPIHESGKYDKALWRRFIVVASMRPRFMNRGSATRRVIYQRRINASMRPRFMNRGSHFDHAFIGQINLASMRPRFMNRGSPWRQAWERQASGRFNEAPIHESGKCIERAQHSRMRGASMRPRFMNRGSAVEPALDPLRADASMRPRFMNRGSLDRACPAR